MLPLMKLVLFIEDSVLHKFLGTAMGVENVAWLRGWKATQLELFPFLVTSPVTSNSIQNRWFRLVPNAPKMIDVVVYEKQKKNSSGHSSTAACSSVQTKSSETFKASKCYHLWNHLMLLLVVETIQKVRSREDSHVDKRYVHCDTCRGCRVH